MSNIRPLYWILFLTTKVHLVVETKLFVGVCIDTGFPLAMIKLFPKRLSASGSVGSCGLGLTPQVDWLNAQTRYPKFLVRFRLG